ncbi:hypothetical protein RHS04_07562 [Rhizoctonia solani]|uniref:Uncharacterized protein n=1 Tax=Rhizoctonia solani TaxID=456999 RepID=A0A8H7LGI7_9AGAM|nr:hypothetical protein RHS04_07562 [Rhizoctonia solani]
MDMMSPPRSLSELDDVSDSGSSLGSGDWTDLSSAHADDASDDGRDGRPVGVLGRMNDGSEEAWTTADALSSSSASAYASLHAPLNPFESDGESERSVRPLPSDTRRELELILPDPLERSDSTLNIDLSFSDAVLAANPTALVSVAGAYPSIAQRSAVVHDVLLAIASAARASLVRVEYFNFASLSGLPSRVENRLAPEKEIVVLVRDHTVAPLTHSIDGTPSILIVFTSDAHESTVPSIHKHSILIPVVLSESRPVVLFDERDDRTDETSVDMTELTRQLSNLFTFERDSVATTQTAVDVAAELEREDKPFDSDIPTQDLDLDNQSLVSFYSETPSDHLLDDTVLVRPGEKPLKPVAPKRQPLDRFIGPERAELLRKLNASMGPGLTAACALAVVLSLVLGTGHLIQSSNPIKAINLAPTSSLAPSSTIHALDPTSAAGTSLALKSPHTSLAVKSSTTTSSLAVKSQHTSLSVRSSSTTALTVKSQQTSLSVRAPVNESCSTVPVSINKAETTSLSTIPVAGTSLSTTTASTSTATATSSPSSAPTAKAHVLHEVVEEFGFTIERVLGLNFRATMDAVRKSDAAIAEAVGRANEAIKAASGIDTAEHVKHASSELRGRHAVARRTAQRQLANLKRGVESLWGEDKEDVKGKGKAKETFSTKGKGKEKEVPRPGREKWHTSKDTGKPPRCERSAKKDKLKEDKPKGCGKCNEKKKIKSKFPTREEAEKAAKSNPRGKRPIAEVEVEWTWGPDAEYEYPFGYGPGTVLQEVQEYFIF